MFLISLNPVLTLENLHSAFFHLLWVCGTFLCVTTGYGPDKLDKGHVCVCGLIVVCIRCAPKCHQAIAEKFIDGAVMFGNLATQKVKI